MGFFRFRRSVKIAPGVRLNFSKSGVSTSIGTRGAHVTLGHGKVRETVGIPGTDVSYVEQQPASSSGGGLVGVVALAIIDFAIVYFLAW